jgi:ribosomal protein L28
MARCAICGKGTMHGRNIRHKHAGRWERRAPKTNRIFRANIQKRTLTIDGHPVRIAICTRCLRTQLKTAS